MTRVFSSGTLLRTRLDSEEKETCYFLRKWAGCAEDRGGEAVWTVFVSTRQHLSNCPWVHSVTPRRPPPPPKPAHAALRSPPPPLSPGGCSPPDTSLSLCFLLSTLVLRISPTAKLGKIWNRVIRKWEKRGAEKPASTKGEWTANPVPQNQVRLR